DRRDAICHEGRVVVEEGRITDRRFDTTLSDGTDDDEALHVVRTQDEIQGRGHESARSMLLDDRFQSDRAKRLDELLAPGAVQRPLRRLISAGPSSDPRRGVGKRAREKRLLDPDDQDISFARGRNKAFDPWDGGLDLRQPFPETAVETLGMAAIVLHVHEEE